MEGISYKSVELYIKSKYVIILWELMDSIEKKNQHLDFRYKMD